jgi:hypothetical protein
MCHSMQIWGKSNLGLLLSDDDFGCTMPKAEI